MNMHRLKELRKEKDLSQAELGERLNIAQGTISNWENGRRNINIEQATDIAVFFGVSTAYLLGLSDDRNLDNENQPAAESSELDQELISLMEGLPQEDFQRVKDFVAGLKAARKEPPSSSL